MRQALSRAFRFLSDAGCAEDHEDGQHDQGRGEEQATTPAHENRSLAGLGILERLAAPRARNDIQKEIDMRPALSTRQWFENLHGFPLGP
jgi:hypothetical protein